MRVRHVLGLDSFQGTLCPKLPMQMPSRVNSLTSRVVAQDVTTRSNSSQYTTFSAGL